MKGRSLSESRLCVALQSGPLFFSLQMFGGILGLVWVFLVVFLPEGTWSVSLSLIGLVRTTLFRSSVIPFLLFSDF